MTKHQKLQLLCLHPEIAMQWISEFSKSVGFDSMEDKRPEMKEELLNLLIEFGAMFFPPEEKELGQKFRESLVLKAVLNLKI